jgi:hypothetical protein
MDFTLFYLESESCADYMETLDSGSTRVQDKHSSARGIPHDLEDMRMAAYEYVGTILIYQLTGLGIIPSRIPAHMGHKDLHAFALEETVERMFEPKGVIVTVAGDSDQRLELRDFGGHVHAAAEISGVPYLIDRLKECLETVVEDTMGVGYESDIHDLQLDEDLLLV